MPLSLAARADEGKEISQMKLDVTEEASGKCTKGVSLKLVCVCVCGWLCSQRVSTEGNG